MGKSSKAKHRAKLREAAGQWAPQPKQFARPAEIVESEPDEKVATETLERSVSKDKVLEKPPDANETESIMAARKESVGQLDTLASLSEIRAVADADAAVRARAQQEAGRASEACRGCSG